MKVSAVAKAFGVEWRLNVPWGGVSANYNNGVRATDSKWVICLSDDTVVTKGWLTAMEYFILMNEDLGLGQLGWPLIFSYRMKLHGLISQEEEFYNGKLRLEDFDPLAVYHLNEDGMGFAPYLRGNCSGSAFVLDRGLFDQMGGFPEDNFQPDEYFGWWTWVNTNRLCVQVPAPPVFHYGGASSWGDHAKHESSPYNTTRRSWERLTGVPFEKRGADSVQIANSKSWKLRDMRFLRWWEDDRT
jgi:hypothetical protein